MLKNQIIQLRDFFFFFFFLVFLVVAWQTDMCSIVQIKWTFICFPDYWKANEIPRMKTISAIKKKKCATQQFAGKEPNSHHNWEPINIFSLKLLWALTDSTFSKTHSSFLVIGIMLSFTGIKRMYAGWVTIGPLTQTVTFLLTLENMTLKYLIMLLYYVYCLYML